MCVTRDSPLIRFVAGCGVKIILDRQNVLVCTRRFQCFIDDYLCSSVYSRVNLKFIMLEDDAS